MRLNLALAAALVSFGLNDCLAQELPAPKIFSRLIGQQYCYTVDVLCKGDKGCWADNGDLRLRLKTQQFVQNDSSVAVKVQRASINGDCEVAGDPGDFAKNNLQGGVTGVLRFDEIPGENMRSVSLRPGESKRLPIEPQTFQITLNPSSDDPRGIKSGRHWLRFWVGTKYKYSGRGQHWKEVGITSEPMELTVDQDLEQKMQHLAAVWAKKKMKPAGPMYCE